MKKKKEHFNAGNKYAERDDKYAILNAILVRDLSGKEAAREFGVAHSTVKEWRKVDLCDRCIIEKIYTASYIIVNCDRSVQPPACL